MQLSLSVVVGRARTCKLCPRHDSSKRFAFAIAAGESSKRPSLIRRVKGTEEDGTVSAMGEESPMVRTSEERKLWPLVLLVM